MNCPTGERVSGQIDRFGAGLTHHFENVTCKVNMNMEKRKEKSYEVGNGRSELMITDIYIHLLPLY